MKKIPNTMFLVICMAMMFLACNRCLFSNGEPSDRARKWRTFLKVAGEDLKGASSGVAAGGAVGGAVGGPGGALIGAGIGGTITGAGASMAAYADIKDKENKQSFDFSPIINLNNPYDHIGETHYLIVNELIDNDLGDSFEGFDNEQYYFQTISLLANNELWTLDELNIFEYNIYSLNFSIVKSSFQDNELASDYVKKIKDLTQEVQNVLYFYIKAFEASTSTSDFINYSINVEDLILNSTQLSSFEKMQVLSVMSTARIGI